MTIPLELPRDTEQRLAEIAERLNVSLNELAAAAVRDLLAQATDEFHAAARRVLETNREVYRRGAVGGFGDEAERVILDVAAGIL